MTVGECRQSQRSSPLAGFSDARPPLPYVVAMFERFTDRAKAIMDFAGDEALRLDHGAIGPGHLLIGLIAEGTGVAAKVVEGRGIDLAALRSTIEARLEPGARPVQEEEGVQEEGVPFDPDGERVLERARAEAEGLDHDYVGSEHVILGLLGDQGVAGQVLADFGLAIEAVRVDVEEFVGGPPVQPSAEEEAMLQRLIRQHLEQAGDEDRDDS